MSLLTVFRSLLAKRPDSHDHDDDEAAAAAAVPLIIRSHPRFLSLLFALFNVSGDR